MAANTKTIRSTLTLFIVLLLATLTELAMATEEPNYTVIEQSGDFELRAYNPMIVAETQVSGPLDEASNAGFKIIADYIFGNNTSQSGDSAKISMTAPVTISNPTLSNRPSSNQVPSKPSSEKISMTAPVTIERQAKQWRMHFVMPAQYTLETLPTPNNPSVTLREVPSRKYAVIRFSGFTGENKIIEKTAKLMTWLKEKGIRPKGQPEIARYNPPWTLPFLRRNEIMVLY